MSMILQISNEIHNSLILIYITFYSQIPNFATAPYQIFLKKINPGVPGSLRR